MDQTKVSPAQPSPAHFYRRETALFYSSSSSLSIRLLKKRITAIYQQTKPWRVSSVCTRFGAQSTTTASLPFMNSGRTTRSSVSLKAVKSSGLLHCSFVSSSSLNLSSSSSAFSGSSLGLDLSSRSGLEPVTRRSLVVRAGKKFQLAQTKRNRSRKSLARTHGFRLRMKTANGRAVLRRRRAKGRWTLCTKSNPSSGKRA